MNNAYNSIIEYGMTDHEADAYKLCILYQEEFRRQFPPESDRIDGATYRRNMLPKRGDPRKSNLFRHCWKLLRETRGLLKDEHKRLYCRAQITAVGNKSNAHLEPNILVGDRAWWRWKVYKWLWEKKLATINSEPPPPSATTTDPKIAKELVFTKKHIFEKCDGEPTPEKLDKFTEDGIMRFWVAQGKVSKYYIVLSPWMKKHKDQIAKECSFDLKLMESKLTDHLKAYFDHEFKHEG